MVVGWGQSNDPLNPAKTLTIHRNRVGLFPDLFPGFALTATSATIVVERRNYTMERGRPKCCPSATNGPGPASDLDRLVSQLTMRTTQFMQPARI